MDENGKVISQLCDGDGNLGPDEFEKAMRTQAREGGRGDEGRQGDRGGEREGEREILNEETVRVRPPSKLMAGGGG